MKWTIDTADPTSLHDQLCRCVRRALAEGDLRGGEHLPPAAELADVLDVNRNTVLTAYRQLRDDGILEFRRGRGVQVSRDATSGRLKLRDAAKDLVELARREGVTTSDLLSILEELQ